MQTNRDSKAKTSVKSSSSSSSSDHNKHHKGVNNNHKKNNNKPNLRVRPTKQLCGERLACKGAKPEAQYLCRDCNSYQCSLCEELLHENRGLESHDRQRLVVTDDQIICDNNCQTRNLADIHCVECNKNFCFLCDQSLHTSHNKKKHQKKPIEQNEDKEDSDEFYSCQYISSKGDSKRKSEATEPLDNIDLNSSGEEEDEPSLRNQCNGTVGSDEVVINKCKGKSYSEDIAQLSIDSPINGQTCGKMTRTGTLIMHSDISEPDVRQSFFLIDENELMKVSSSDEFAAKMGCSPTALIKVVSIFGNTGEGKSHTLNYTFFEGKEMFKTSAAQNSCTIGIWCAYDPYAKVITIDTEGLLGISENNNRRTRLLLKVLAISDIIIYRTRAERLHEDLFTFLGDASRVYVQHFSKELKAAIQRCKLLCPLSDLGPTVIIFHETLHTETLCTENDLTPEDYIRKRFQQSDQSIEAFSALEYVGTQTITPPTNFKPLQETVRRHLNNTTVRSSRTSAAVFTALKMLNEKFSGDINKCVSKPFFDEYFKCSSRCMSCNAQCDHSMNHLSDGKSHTASHKCKYQHQYNNQIFICKDCNDRGEQNIVIPKTAASDESTWLGIAKYAWSGYILECKFCGIIYRSRQYWYGNKEPTEQSVVRTEIQHVWPDEPMPSQGSQNVGQRAIDTLGYVSTSVSQITAGPSKVLADWMADKIAPAYWVPNNRIQHCGGCKKEFQPLDQKHHCRLCGGGYCEDCSSKSRPVPERGWGDQPVRVCDECFEKGERTVESPNTEVTPRIVGEMIQNGIETIVQAIDYPIEWIKDTARPEYWIPDKDITNCFVCKIEFNEKLAIHHCRACGQGVCDCCSQTRRSVLERGWDTSVRVCDDCQKKSTHQ